MNYFKLLKEISRLRENKDFLVIDEKKYTYGEVYNASKLLGQKLNNLIKTSYLEDSKNKLLIYCDDFYFQLLIFFASNFFEQIPIIAHNSLKAETIMKIIIQNNIQYVISDKYLKFDNVRTVEINRDILGFEEILIYKTNVLSRNVKNFKVCMGALTSGSTDIPKVLYRTYESWSDFFKIQNKIFKINLDSKVFINGSLSFTGNLNVVMSVLYEGGTIISVSNFNCKKWMLVIDEEKVTNIYLVPTKLKMLNTFLKESVDSVRSIFTGSQLLFEKTADKLMEKFPNSEITLYYGASELNYITYLNYEEIRSKPLSVGRPFPNIDIIIKDDFIYVNTKYHVEGMRNPCTVYDMGYVDSEGYLIFEGREDNVINKGGFKISGIKIENEIKRINGISDVAVIGYDHEKKGKEIAAFIIVNKDITKKTIIEKLKINLMPIEIPKKIIFIQNMPLNSSGKIDRFKLIEDNLPDHI
ncbi:AMP-binding protein [Clostridium sp.]|uniref:AMP-binding protein n=1 Tax=Clostridium sp. TaxID=1506 RepID=UPI002625BB99|nr:AMP-binding protein [Clostridium sp.]